MGVDLNELYCDQAVGDLSCLCVRCVAAEEILRLRTLLAEAAEASNKLVLALADARIGEASLRTRCDELEREVERLLGRLG